MNKHVSLLIRGNERIKQQLAQCHVRYWSNEIGVEEFRDPRLLLKKELSDIVNLRVGRNENLPPVPRETDIAIIGGGAVGLSVAYWLKRRFPRGFNVTVIEKDPTYTQAATALSLGGIRQQFSLKENVQMSLFASEFLRDVKEHLTVQDVVPPDVQFHPQGYLFLASERSTEIMKKNYETQCKEGSKVELLDTAQLKIRFPWLNVSDIAMGSYGLQNEGWFDPYLFLAALKLKCASLEVQFVQGEVNGFTTKDVLIRDNNNFDKAYREKNLDQVCVHSEGKTFPMKFAYCVNCAGPWAGNVARLAGIGEGRGILSTALPVEPRKRFVFLVQCPDGPDLSMPFLIDNSGAYIRREGVSGHYLCGISPSFEEEPSVNDLLVDHNVFEEKLWPILAHRMPAFQSLKVKGAWAGYYDYNAFDQNLIIGAHPYHERLYFACGSSGHGIQHAIAIGRAVMELIIDGQYSSIDLRRFNFERILNKQPLFESNII